MKVFRILSLMCLLAIAAFGQRAGRVQGKVSIGTDSSITVRLVLSSEKQRFETTTNSQGYFVFEDIPSGNYKLQAFSSQTLLTKSDVEIKNGHTSFIEIKTTGATDANAIVALTEEVNVEIGTGTSQPISEVSKTVNIIDGQEMRERADFTLADTLRTIPGFRVQQLGGFGRTASNKTRGLRNQDTAVLIDGIRFRDVTAITGDASPFLSDFTLTSVSRIEVLRGSGSSLYGTNAIGGVLDFQTPEPQPGLHGQVSVAFGGLGLGRFRGNISDGTRDRKFGYNVGVSRTVYTKGIDGEDNAHNTNFQSRIEYKPFSKTQISGRFFVSDAFVRLNTSPNTLGTLPLSNAAVIDAIPLSIAELRRFASGTPITQINIGNANFMPDANDPDNRQRSQFFSGQAALTQVINGTLVFQGHYQGLRTSRRNMNGPRGVGFQPFSGADETDLFKGQIHTLNGHFDWTPNSMSRTTAGYEYEWERFANEHITIVAGDNFSVRAKQSSHTFYAQELLSFFKDRLQISGAFRAQFFLLKQPAFTPISNPTYQNLQLENPPTAYTGDGSASYFIRSTGTKFRAHVGNGYRVPSLYERFGSFYFFGFFSSSGNPNLGPERSIAGDAGIDQSLLSDRVRFSATYFYTDIRKSIDFAFCVPQCLPPPDPLGRFSGYYNTEGRIARGIETSADIRPSISTRIFASYTFINSDERNPLNLFIVTSPGIPTHQFSIVATQRIGKRFWVNFDFVGTSSYLFPFYNFNFFNFSEKYYMYRFKGARRGDLTAGYTFPLNKEKFSLRLFGTVENVFDHEYYENGFRTVGRNGRVGLSFGF